MSFSVNADIGDGHPLAVFTTWPDEIYRLGSEVTITVHVFKAGEYHDSDIVGMGVGAQLRSVDLTRVGVGRHEGTFIVEEQDCRPTPVITVLAWVRDLGPPEIEAVDWSHFYVEDIFPLGVDIYLPHSKDQFPVPGQTVEFEVLFSHMGEPVDQGLNNLSVILNKSMIHERELEVSRIDTGRYSGCFTVPDNIRLGIFYRLYAAADYTHGNFTVEGERTRQINVDFFRVWVHGLEVSEDKAILETYVLDTIGKAVENATISLLDYRPEEPIPTEVAVTDADGRASFEVEVPDLDPQMDGFNVYGQVESSSYTQRFQGRVVLGDIENRWDEQPEVDIPINLLNDLPLPLGSDVILEFVASVNGTPLVDSEIHSYIAYGNRMYAATTKTTDSKGRFDIAIETPELRLPLYWSDNIFARFTIEFNGTWHSTYRTYDVGSEMPMGELLANLDDSTSVTVGPFTLGSKVNITMSNDEADGENETAMIVWGIEPLSHWNQFKYEEVPPAWGPWNRDRYLFTTTTPCTWLDGVYRANFTMPEFLPWNGSLFVFGELRFFEPGGERLCSALEQGVAPIVSNDSPEVAIITPEKGEVLSGQAEVEGTAFDDHGIERVEVRIDDGDWSNAEGTTIWTYSLVTTGLAYGNHTIEAKSFDGTMYSEINTVVIKVDNPPVVTVEVPLEGGSYNGTIVMRGTASDDNSVESVRLFFNDVSMEKAEGTNSWSFGFDTTEWDRGNHLLVAIADDGTTSSEPVRVVFFIDQPPECNLTTTDLVVGKDRMLRVSGSGVDDKGIVRVEFRINEGNWITVNGTEEWSFELDTSDLEEGSHTLEIRSFDGDQYSRVVKTSFDVKGKSKPKTAPAFGAFITVIGLLSAVIAHQSRRGR
jgi:hypothetical protein